MQTCDCLHYHVFTCVVRLTHMCHVLVPRRRLYDSSALHIVGGIIHISLLSLGLSPGEIPSETKPSAVLCCNRHISLDSFRHALHTKKKFSPVHFGCVLLAENRHYTRRDYGSTGHDFCFRLHKLYKLHGSFLFPFLIRVHCSSTIKTK